MQNIKEFIHSYFEKNKPELVSNYPGLKFKRLLDDYCQFHQIKETDVHIDLPDTFIEKLQQGVPLEYILKESYFYKSSFYVDPNVLIPRSETEILVEDSIQFLDKHSEHSLKMCEIGVGSFIIGLTIAMESQKRLDITGGDICPNALEVARINLFRHANLVKKGNDITLKESDRFENIKGDFDFIVTNPPYIKMKSDREGVHLQAHQFEPHIALYLEDDAYDMWFDDLFKTSSKRLRDNGAFFMEGHEDNLERLKIIAEKYFSRVELKNDYTHRLRFLYAYK